MAAAEAAFDLSVVNLEELQDPLDVCPNLPDRLVGCGGHAEETFEVHRFVQIKVCESFIGNTTLLANLCVGFLWDIRLTAALFLSALPASLHALTASMAQ